MEIKLISYIPAIFGVAIIGLFILLNNYKDTRNRLFASFNFLIAIWLSCLLVADMAISKSIVLYALRFALFFGALVFVSFYYFSLFFPYKRQISFTKQAVVSVPIIVIALLSFTPLLIETVTIQNFGAQPDRVGLLYTISDIIGVLYLVAGLSIMISKYKKSNKEQKAQIRFVSYALSIALIVNVFTGIVLTFLKVDSQYVSLGGFSLLIFSMIVGYSMLKHKLFDIRLVVIRSLGYVLSLSLILTITALVIFGLSNKLVEIGVSQNIRLWLYVLITLIFSLSFQPIKRAFDSLTRKLFYRDAYDTQVLLNEFNKVIVSTIDLELLLERAGVTIEKYLKPESSAFAIRDSKDDVIRLISAEEPELSKEAIEQVRGYAHQNPDKLFVTDALEETQSDLKELLQKANVGMLARITTDPSVEGNGYIVMGYKKSGNMYNTQDTGAMEIVANELAIAMQNALQFEEIQRFNVTLQDKVEDATKQLRKTNDKLKQMDETKDEFISMASHQLRTPLTSVKGYLSMVLEGDAGDLNEMQNKLLDQAFVSSQRMVYLIADLLNVSRLRTGKFIIDSVSANLADIIKGEVEQLVETAASRGLTLKYDKPKNFPNLLIDETKIRQVCMNFIDNAIYYTPKGGHITIGLKDNGKTIEYTVVDDGLGVPKSEQHHLFNKFFRAGNAKKARPDGTGLGLFMAKKVIVAQGGSLIFKSQEGKGSTFGFSFSKEKLKVPDNYEQPEPLNGIKSGPGASK